MNDGLRHRAILVSAFLSVVLVLTGTVWRHGFQQGLDQLSARGEADLALAGDRLVGQLQRYRDLAVVMADHPSVAEALANPESGRIDALLLEIADKSGTLDLLVLDMQGNVVSASQSATLLDLRMQKHVQRALRGALGWGHGPAAPLTDRAFYHAAPVLAKDGKVQGAVVVVTDLNGIDYNWRGTNPAAFFTDASGVVYVSNRTELLLWRRADGGAGLVPPQGLSPAFVGKKVGTYDIWQLGLSPYLPQQALHMTREFPVIGLTGEVLLSVEPARRLALAQAAAVAALCLAFGSLLFVAGVRRRALAQANVMLEARVTERTTALRDSNAKLLREAAEREEAQAALRRAQDDLVQAGKLSALGLMSAGISHELNQPLMAIRSFSQNAVKFMERGAPERASENLTRISDMAGRMGRIIQNLRAFARQESGTVERIELGKVLQSALDLTRVYVEDAGVQMVYQQPEGDIWVQGGEVRLGQVFVNLITNAVDAMGASPRKRLEIAVINGEHVHVTITDTGPGIEMPDKVFDPFYTTKSGGETGGMGLGLSISYGIVQSFGGQIKGQNLATGGARFTVVLERAGLEVVPERAGLEVAPERATSKGDTA